MQEMFQGCSNLEYINMYNFDENKLEKINSIFSDIPENIVVCLKEMKPESKIYFELINEKRCPVFDCSNDWKSRQKKLIYNNNYQCFDNCAINQQYPYEYNGKCYDQCQFGFLYDENNNKMDKCKCQLDLCLLCPNSALRNNLCTKCITNYYPKENDPLNMGEYIKCYKEPEGYYLDLDIYRQSFYTCQTCDISGNHKEHNCIKCNVNYPFKIQKYNYFNCYENCNYYYYLDNEYKYHCTKDLSCPNEYPKLNEGEIECIKYNIEDIINNLIIKERIEIEKMSKEEEIEYYDNIIKMVEIGFTGPYDTSNIDLGKDEYIITEKMIITFTTLQNQKIDIGKNMSTIDLGFCENKLRNYYNISKNETLYMKKTEVIQVGFKIPKIEFDIYSKLLGNNLIKLNITVCGESKITISIPIELTDNMDKLNSSSGYYNDICYTITSEDGTDVTLKDRKKDFIDKNMTVCQEDCEFSEYDKENNKVKCICNIEETSSSIANIKINKAKLFENFKDIKNIVNFNFLVCYKNLLKKDGIIYNIGSYIILTIIIFHILSILIFFISEFSLIKKKINKIIFGMNKEKKSNEIMKEKKIKKEKSKKNSNKISINRKIKRRKSNKKINIKAINNDSEIKIISKNNQLDNDGEKINYLLDYIDEEINELSYDLAKQYDKRNFCQYYISLIKTKHILIFALFNNNDYNSKIIKINLFFIVFTIDYIVNALFYNDDTMHKIYQSKGKFDFEYQLPIIVYSNLISMILNLPLNYLSLTNDAIINFKQNKSIINEMVKRAKYLENKLTFKFVLYFVIGFLFLSFFWYYISMFCVIYRNTQIHLLKDTLFSFSLSLLFPFGYYFLPGFFRIPALSNQKNKRKCLYNFSKFLQEF